MLIYINWTVNPELISLGPITFRWYGILFALGVVAGYQLTKQIFKHENLSEKMLDNLLYITVAGTIIGARLGHVFFYDWDYYSQNLAEIPQVWKGGLASHGAGIGILLSLWVYSKFILKTNYLWILDRTTLAVAAASICIRLGNLMNHEIVGNPTKLFFGFVFELVDDQPRHPTQLYESISWAIILILLYRIYWKKDSPLKPGLLFGLFLTLAFTARFLLEFTKKSQGGFEKGLGNILSTGQWLSIPFIISGIILLLSSAKQHVSTNQS